MLPVVSKPTRSTAVAITSGVSRSYGISSRGLPRGFAPAAHRAPPAALRASLAPSVAPVRDVAVVMFFRSTSLRRTIFRIIATPFGRNPNLLRKPTTLIAGKFGSRHFGTKPYLADAVRLTDRDKPVALYIGAASGDDRNFGSALSTL